MTFDNATPRPWRLHGNFIERICAGSTGPEGVDVASCSNGIRQPGPQTRMDNAALIVAAVNSYNPGREALIAGLVGAADEVLKHRVGNISSRTGYLRDNDLSREALEALEYWAAKARGQA